MPSSAPTTARSGSNVSPSSTLLLDPPTPLLPPLPPRLSRQRPRWQRPTRPSPYRALSTHGTGSFSRSPFRRGFSRCLWSRQTRLRRHRRRRWTRSLSRLRRRQGRQLFRVRCRPCHLSATVTASPPGEEEVVVETRRTSRQRTDRLSVGSRATVLSSDGPSLFLPFLPLLSFGSFSPFLVFSLFLLYPLSLLSRLFICVCVNRSRPPHINRARSESFSSPTNRCVSSVLVSRQAASLSDHRLKRTPTISLPPSTLMTAPSMYPPAGEARKRTGPAISCSCPGRRRGTWSR